MAGLTCKSAAAFWISSFYPESAQTLQNADVLLEGFAETQCAAAAPADGLAGAIRSLKTVSRQVLFKIKTKKE